MRIWYATSVYVYMDIILSIDFVCVFNGFIDEDKARIEVYAMIIPSLRIFIFDLTFIHSKKLSVRALRVGFCGSRV